MPDDRYSPGDSQQFVPSFTAPGMIIRASFGEGNRVLQFERAVDADEPVSEINRICDVMTQVGDRLKAKFELPGLRRQRENVRVQHDENVQRREDALAEMEVFKQARLAKAGELDAKHKALYEKAYGEYYEKGYMGAFVPEGALKSNLEAIKKEIGQLSAPLQGREQDCINNLVQLDNEIASGKRALAQLDQLIKEAEALARGEDISGV